MASRLTKWGQALASERRADGARRADPLTRPSAPPVTTNPPTVPRKGIAFSCSRITWRHRVQGGNSWTQGTANRQLLLQSLATTSAAAAICAAVQMPLGVLLCRRNSPRTAIAIAASFAADAAAAAPRRCRPTKLNCQPPHLGGVPVRCSCAVGCTQTLLIPDHHVPISGARNSLWWHRTASVASALR